MFPTILNPLAMKTEYHFTMNGVNTSYSLTCEELEKKFKVWLKGTTTNEENLRYLLANSTGLKVVKLILKFLLENDLGLNSNLVHEQDEIEVIDFLASVFAGIRKKFMESLM